jgi:lantibiotic leader peptide-processing serine protease
MLDLTSESESRDRSHKEADVRRWGFLAVLALVPGLVVLPGAVSALGANRSYIVVYRAGTSLDAAHAAVRAAGGTLVHENTDIGVATAASRYDDFVTRVAGQAALEGAARNRPIAWTASGHRPTFRELEELSTAERAQAVVRSKKAGRASHVRVEPLSPLQWDMKQIHATASGSYGVERGSRKVLVGIIDTGIDGSHPDIKPNFNKKLSRNFTTDIPIIDGSCASDPDGSCKDPADVDEDGHGTHVAGIVGAALNGLGTAGVAPGVTLVNLRAGQDSGFFFLQETVDALTYAGKVGVDVVNMSFFTDPWLYNCPNHPDDTAAEQLQQRTIIKATQRAVDYAFNRGVTLIAALGNENTDLGHPTFDDTSPDFPPDTARERTVNNKCLDMPAEAKHVISVSSLGPTERKADYSNYGVEQTDVSAPGGWFRDLLGTPAHRTVGNLILSPYPTARAIANDELNADGTPNTPFVVRDCAKGKCAYYQYLQGTSMAAPHAVGVVALIVSRWGKADPKHSGGLTLSGREVEKILYRTARNHRCPNPRLFTYTDVGRTIDFDAYCAGGKDFNGFYGNGIVDALAAVRRG